MEKVTVRICQRDYSLKTDESPEKIVRLAEQLEQTIHFVSRKARGMNETEITTLAAMLLISDIENILKKNYISAEEAESKLRNVKDRLDDLRKEMAEQAAVARKEKEKIIANANEEKETLIAEANEEKETLIAKANEEKEIIASELKQSRQNEINLGAKIDELNKQLEKQAVIITEDSIKKEQLKNEKQSLSKEL